MSSCFLDRRKQIGSGESQLSSVSRPTDVSNHEISVSAKQAMSVAVRKRKILDKFLVRKATVDEEYWVITIFQLSWSCSRKSKFL